MSDPVLSDEMLQAYAAGTYDWADIRNAGFDYVEVLAGLGRLGLRPPVAPMEGPNVEARQRGLRMLREALDRAKP